MSFLAGFSIGLLVINLTSNRQGNEKIFISILALFILIAWLFLKVVL